MLMLDISDLRLDMESRDSEEASLLVWLRYWSELPAGLKAQPHSWCRDFPRLHGEALKRWVCAFAPSHPTPSRQGRLLLFEAGFEDFYGCYILEVMSGVQFSCKRLWDSPWWAWFFGDQFRQCNSREDRGVFSGWNNDWLWATRESRVYLSGSRCLWWCGCRYRWRRRHSSSRQWSTLGWRWECRRSFRRYWSRGAWWGWHIFGLKGRHHDGLQGE